MDLLVVMRGQDALTYKRVTKNLIREPRHESEGTEFISPEADVDASNVVVFTVADFNSTRI